MHLCKPCASARSEPPDLSFQRRLGVCACTRVCVCVYLCVWRLAKFVVVERVILGGFYRDLAGSGHGSTEYCC